MSTHLWHTINDFIAGWVGGAAGLIIGHPLDTIKVRQQTIQFKFWSTIRTTLKFEGLKGFYKGFWAPFLIIGPANALFFSVYGECLRLLQHSEEDRLDYQNPHWARHTIFAGTIAGFAQVLVTCPAELIKTVLQVNISRTSRKFWSPLYKTHPHYRDTSEAIVAIYRHRGIAGFYKGGVSMIWRDVPASAVFTLVYEWGSHQGDQKLWKLICAGGSAGVISWVSTLPFDVVKSRLQGDDPFNPTYKGMMDCFYKSYKAEGLRVFGKGFWLITVRAFPVNAVTLIAYEKCLQLLNQ